MAAAGMFTDRTAESGIMFRHEASKTSRKYLIESAGAGVAMIDYDSDSLLDLYFVNGAKLDDPMRKGAKPDKRDSRYWNRLYRNAGGGRYEDVTEKAGVMGGYYGMGAAVGDYDNDGDADLYVTGFPANLLYRNRGDGTFENVTERAGVAGGGWSTSAAFVDVDGDGWLDLAAARYVEWDFEPDIWCGARREGYRSYCHPDQFRPAAHLLYRNRGDGTFEDISERSGFGKSPGKGLGIAINDYDRDGRVDIVVANDSFPQQLFHNEGEGRLREVGLDAGIAYDDDGKTYGGMGVDFDDYDNDGWPDVIINALAMQRYALYGNVKGMFEYASTPTAVDALTRLSSGWGMRWLDVDRDGRKDIVVAQGHVMDNIELTQPNLKYKEPLLWLRNAGGKFVNASEAAGSAFREPLPARGMAAGDLNNDGAIDLVVNCNDAKPVILMGAAGAGGNWLIVDARGTRGSRDAIGAKVRIVTESGEQHRMVTASSSYLSAGDRRAHFGLGGATTVKLVEVTWPGGRKSGRRDVAANQVLRVVEAE
jgi:hypothetical protein